MGDLAKNIVEVILDRRALVDAKRGQRVSAGAEVRAETRVRTFKRDPEMEKETSMKWHAKYGSRSLTPFAFVITLQ